MRKIFLFFLFVSLSASLQAQALTNSPYSRQGVGDLFMGNSIRNQSMGGIGFGSSHSYSINRLNPASYRRIAMSTLDFSGFSEVLDMKTTTAENKLNTSGINQFAYAFPTNFKTTFALGLSPYSVLGYRFQNDYTVKIDTSLEKYTIAYSGSGGLTSFYGGAAISIFKGLDLGINAEFVFGNSNYAWNLSFTENETLNPVSYQRKLYQQGFNFTGGLQYTDTVNIRSGNKIVAKGGFVFDRGAKLSSDQYLISRNLNPNKFTPDTLADVVKDNVQVPVRIGFGIEIEKYLVPGAPLTNQSYWSAGLDIAYQDWSSYSAFGVNPGFGKNIRFAAGGEWIPRISSKVYFLKMAYRLGGNVEQSHIIMNGTQLNSMGLTFGFGLPFARTASKINLGMEIGKRGTTDNNLIAETYYRFRLGLTLNERWFLRYRQD